MTAPFDIERTGWDDPRIVRMRDEMDAEVQPLYADLRDLVPRVGVDPADILVTLVAVRDGDPIGTAALKRTGPYGEVKRVFVREAGRRLGVATALMDEIEAAARELGFRELFLQTGVRQPKAMALYEREGWAPVAPFGPYEGDTVLSRCYAKPLARPLTAADVRQGEGADPLADIAAADAAGADLVLLDDAAAGPSLDAAMLAGAAADVARRAAIAPRVRVTHTEPFHVAKAIQTIDWVTGGRAGWVVDVATTEAEARAFGRRPAPDADEAWREAEAVAGAARRLWDSWEDEAEIRDIATGRFVDRDRIHRVDVDTEWFRIAGPSIVPRSPQGQIPVIVDLTGEPAEERFAAAQADVVRVRLADPDAARDAIARVRGAAGHPIAALVDLDLAAPVRAPHARDDAEDLAAWAALLRARTGADGVVARGIDAVRALAAEGSGPTLRDRLGLSRPASRYAKEDAR